MKRRVLRKEIQVVLVVVAIVSFILGSADYATETYLKEGIFVHLSAMFAFMGSGYALLKWGKF